MSNKLQWRLVSHNYENYEFIEINRVKREKKCTSLLMISDLRNLQGATKADVLLEAD